ncbi:MAG TPA: hypothetical protein VK464_26400 [Symbiobacteriaceae bacterium]|nr:hypothetical protein [Symbiobacteriaceae bacterium]
MGEWTEFRELASSTGYIFLVVILLWSLLAGIIYWAFVSGTTSMKEEVKFKVIEDDQPVSH